MPPRIAPRRGPQAGARETIRSEGQAPHRDLVRPLRTRWRKRRRRVAGIENDIDEIEDEVFGGKADVSRRIYELSREVITFQRATTLLPEMIGQLMEDPEVDDEEGRHLRDVRDHALWVQEHADAFRQLLQNILNVNLTLETQALSEVSIAQSEEIKKISAWAAILFAPTVVGTVYGMNFEHIPELEWQFGYPLALGLMLAISLTLYVFFKRRGWI